MRPTIGSVSTKHWTTQLASGPWCAHDSFELTIRTGKGGRYLCVLNPDTRDIREDEVIVAGLFPVAWIWELVPACRCQFKQNAETRFKLRLHPGESTIVSLSRE